MKVHEAERLASVRDPRRVPKTRLPEIAFAGRSNVGKSSLLNALLMRRKPLAPISKRPGRTRSVDLYLIRDRDLIFVDLPGYGYSAVSARERMLWQPLVEGYMRGRRQLACVIILVDSRRGPEQEEWALISWLNSLEIDWFIVFTKADKLNQSERAGLRRAMGELGYRENDHYLLVSAKTRSGLPALWKLIENMAERKRKELTGTLGF